MEKVPDVTMARLAQRILKRSKRSKESKESKRSMLQLFVAHLPKKAQSLGIHLRPFLQESMIFLP